MQKLLPCFSAGRCTAVFGRKDYQQLAVIRYLVRDLAMPVRIEAGATLREADGLAMSSRNQYLTDDERRIAPILYGTLQGVARDLQSGKRNYGELEAAATSALASIILPINGSFWWL